MPNKPQITNITGGPNELNIYWKCKDFDHPHVKATVTLWTDPLVPIPQGYEAIVYSFYTQKYVLLQW